METVEISAPVQVNAQAEGELKCPTATTNARDIVGRGWAEEFDGVEEEVQRTWEVVYGMWTQMAEI